MAGADTGPKIKRKPGEVNTKRNPILCEERYHEYRIKRNRIAVNIKTPPYKEVAGFIFNTITP